MSNTITPRHRRIAAAAAALATALLLGGCSGVPTHSRVEVGLSDLSQTEQYVQFDPAGPVPGSDQEEIIRGFVNAASSANDNYRVAREFLTPNYANQWEPSSGVMIDDSSRNYRADGDNVGVLQIQTIAHVNEQGVLATTVPGPRSELRFELEQINGQWRIASAPAGVLLDRNTFTAVWSPHPVYFPANAGGFIVDERWYPSRSSLVTNIVTTLLRGPSSALQPSARTALPETAVLIGDSVAVADGKALIEVTAEAETVTPEMRNTIRDQLRYSLLSVAGVTGYELTINGVNIASDSVAPFESTANSDRPPIVAVGTQFGTLTASEVEREFPVSAQIAAADPSAVALAGDGETAAMRTPDGVVAVTQTSQQLIDSRAGVLPPTMDAWGYIWSATEKPSDELQVFLPGVAEYEFPLPAAEDRRVAGIGLSPDGNRLAVMFASGKGTEIRVSTVVRDTDGLPLTLSEEQLTVLWTPGTPTDFDWIDDTRVAVLSTQSGVGKVTVGGVGVFSAERGSVPEAKAIAGTSNLGQMRVLTSDGQLLSPQGVSGWQTVVTGVQTLGTWG